MNRKERQHEYSEWGCVLEHGNSGNHHMESSHGKNCNAFKVVG